MAESSKRGRVRRVLAKKRSNQLVIESAIIGALLILIVGGGTIVTGNIPPAWRNLQNPNTVTTQYDMPGIAKYYNLTLALLGSARFQKVSFYIDTFQFVNIPQSLNQTATIANSDIATMNDSISLAMADFANASAFVQEKEYVNASYVISDGCNEIKNSNASLMQFQNPTTPELERGGVPTSLYSIGLGMVAQEISRLYSECLVLSSSYPLPPANNSKTILLIASPQKSILIEGNVPLNGNLTQNGVGISGQSVAFYVNGTFIGSAFTDNHGYLSANLTIPFVYEPEVVIWAYAKNNASFPGAISNNLYFVVNYNETQIVVSAG